MALSPEPRPSTTRPPESSSTLEMALAETTGCRVSGLVTSGPIRMRVVLSAATVSETYSSRNTDCESATPSQSNPLSSTSRHSAPKPSSVSGRTTMPKRACGTISCSGGHGPDEVAEHVTKFPPAREDRQVPEALEGMKTCAGDVLGQVPRFFERDPHVVSPVGDEDGHLHVLEKSDEIALRIEPE